MFVPEKAVVNNIHSIENLLPSFPVSMQLVKSIFNIVYFNIKIHTFDFNI